FKVQIYPLITSDKNPNISKLNLYPAIYPKESQSRADFTSTTLTRLYRTLEMAIQKKPWRWECWSYLHSNGMIKESNVYQLKQELQWLYLFINSSNGYYLFDTRYYSAQKINFIKNS